MTTRPERISGVVAALLAGALCTAPGGGGRADAASGRLDPAVAGQLAAGGPSTPIAVLIHLRTSADLRIVHDADRRHRAGHVETLLRSHATTAQRGLLTMLRHAPASGRVSDVRPWWIDNSVSLTAMPEVIRAIAARSDVASVQLDQAPITPQALPAGAPSQPPAPNVAAIGAPSLWARGITGQGTVVADLDTGVDGTQPDLVGSYRGGADSWFDPYGQHSSPTDINGHGTWTTSVMVGRDRSGQSLGVAPDAQWIAARVFDDSNRATLSAVHAALQWALDPSGDPAHPNPPNVVNASWSSANNTCSTEFEPDLAALRAAGIVPVFAAGNSGPASNSGMSPATLPEALAVGNVDGTNTVDASSSRGPSACAGRTHFPDLVAPGVNIPVDDLYGGTWTASGTSLAAPHVAGALALLLSAHPNVTAGAQQAALTSTARDLGAPGTDDTYGAGLIDVVAAEAALGSAPPPGPVTSAVTVTPNPVGGATRPTVTATVAAAPGGNAPAGATASVDGGAAETMTLTAGTASLTLTGPLADGPHTVAVRGSDAAGTAGAAASVPFVVDRTAPTVGSPLVSPSPTAGATSVSITDTASDAGSGVAYAEAWADTDPGVRRGSALTITRGTGGSVSLGGTLGVTGLAVGTHVVSVRALDAAGNATVATGSLTVSTPPPTAFSDGFENGTTAAWSSAGGSGRAVTPAAALAGYYGLAVTASTAGGWVRTAVPGTSGSLNVRVLFRPYSLATSSVIVPITSGGGSFAIQYKTSSSGAQVRLSATAANGATKTTAWFTVPASSTSFLEVDLQPAQGTASFYVANTVRGTLSGLSATVPATIDVGLVGAQSSSVRGTGRFDAVVVNRTGHVGLGTTGL